MSETKFTPGPYRVDSDDLTVILDPDGNSIGEAFGFGTMGDEDRANAALFVAAPELYAACETIVSQCDRCDDGMIESQPAGIEGFDGAGNPRIEGVACPWCGSARSALARARGEGSE